MKISVVGSFQSVVDEDESLLGCDAGLIGNLLLMFWRNLLPPFSEQSNLFIRLTLKSEVASSSETSVNVTKQHGVVSHQLRFLITKSAKFETKAIFDNYKTTKSVHNY